MCDRTTKYVHWALESLAGRAESLGGFRRDRSRFDRKMQEDHALLLGYPREIGRPRLPGGITVRLGAHDGPATLPGEEPHVFLEDLPGHKDLGREFHHAYLQVILFHNRGPSSER